MTDVKGGSPPTVPRTAAATVTQSGSHGVVSPFDGNEEEWIDYTERLENYFVANNIANEAKLRAILRTVDVSPNENAMLARRITRSKNW